MTCHGLGILHPPTTFHLQNERSQWGSIIFVEYDCLQQQKHINQPDFFLHFQKVFVGLLGNGHVSLLMTIIAHLYLPVSLQET
jgi:hypothetical protein